LAKYKNFINEYDLIRHERNKYKLQAEENSAKITSLQQHLIEFEKERFIALKKENQKESGKIKGNLEKETDKEKEKDNPKNNVIVNDSQKDSFSFNIPEKKDLNAKEDNANDNDFEFNFDQIENENDKPINLASENLEDSESLVKDKENEKNNLSNHVSNSNSNSLMKATTEDKES